MFRTAIDDFNTLERHIDIFFDNFFSKRRRFSLPSENLWKPPTDVFETSNHLVIKIELSGVLPEDVNIEIVENALIVTGKRVDTPPLDRTNFYQMEIPYGYFETRVELPIPVKIPEAKAKFENGFLKVLFPKTEKEEKKISISIKFEE